VSLLLPENVTVDIYRGFDVNSPYPPLGATPDVPSVSGLLKHHVRNGRFGSASILHWTHVLYLPPDTDIRSAYNSQLNTWQSANADTVILADYPIDGWCTAFLAVLVQRIHRGTPEECLRAYLDRLQPREGSCQQGIVLGCCPNPLPETLHATIPTGSGCPCLDGVVIELDYDAATQSWKGSAIVCASETLSLVFQCGTTSCDDATLSLTFDNHGSVGPVTTNPGCGCSPLQMTFSNINFPIQGIECDGAVTVVVTA
jgi:hypothetical protein